MRILWVGDGPLVPSGLEHEKNCLVFDTAEEAVELAGDFSRGNLGEIAAAGLRLAQERHTWSARMSELVPYLNAARAARETP